MTQRELQEYLNKGFQGEESFLESIIFPIFGEQNYDSAYRLPVLDDEQLKGLALRTGIEEIIKYGTVTIGHIVIDIFEVTVQDNVQMNRNRVTIQQLIRHIMDTYSSAFIIFHYQDNWQLDWRFSFCQKDDKNMTEAKRYTFMLGPNQSCKTASQNFLKLFGRGSNITREEIVSAFDVEALSDEFFGKYSTFYADFVEYITGKRIELVNNEWKEIIKHKPHEQMYADFGRNDKAVRDYIKRTLGRIVFLHFLQKKGWMGVEPGKDWGSGDLQFMKHLYEASTEEQKDDFLDAVLEPLFDKALDTMPNNEQWLYDTGVKALPNNGVLRFPYMNGGLFERDAYDKIPTRFPREMFAEFLEFLYEYNFTIDENDPNDAEVGVDPEMLGQIFENLLEDNKFKGAYYTKKEVVQYMAKEALIAYLETGMENDSEKDSIRHFVSTYNADSLADTQTKKIGKLLKEVKLCDPAIGSGAYPMGVLKEIFRCRLAIEDFSAERYADIKRYIIQNNIYGVDIEQGAVEIARLRFWLSLVVDEVSPKALPNLDYKIVAGNSLLTTFNGHYVNIDVIASHPNATAIAIKKQRLVALKNQYFTLAGNQKYQCEIEIKRLILDIVELQLCFERLSKTLKRYQSGNLFDENNDISSLKEEEIARTIMPEQQELIDNVGVLRTSLTDNNIPLKVRAQIFIPFFDWNIMFSDIFQQGGFDIVLGNPPYISAPNQLLDSALTQQREDIKKCGKFTTLNEKWDLYVPFMELGINLLKTDGVFTMIVPYPLTNQKYGKKLRQYFCEHNRVIEVVDAKGFKLFKNATVENCIPLIRKGKSTEAVTIAHYHDDKSITKDYQQSILQLIQDPKTYVWNLTQDERNTNKYDGLHILGDFCYISKGMVVNAHENTDKGAFKKEDLISKTKDEIHCRAYLEAKDIDRYKVKRIRFLEWNTKRCPDALSRPTFRELYDRPRIILNCLGRINCTIDVDSHYLHNHSIYCAVPWSNLHGIDNKSISSSIKKYCNNQKREVLERNSEVVQLYYLLGILNSSKANELLSDQRGGDYHIYPEHIRNIPIPIASKENQETIGNLAMQIIEVKALDPSTDTSALESEIDCLVSQLYNDAKDNVQIVDPETTISLEENESNK